ncbi:four helix bundle protein [Terriglobus albidus]|uniref:four helix bundle protein n=1 Tax=Terriglobus albidus TaxID=1592106 RepID=UPI0021E042C6|nr:four helix bundle protein [Terriglobus albidus]
MAKSFRELLVWQKSMQLAESVYRNTDGFPPREIYGLAAQMRRAAVSIPSNLAEGSNRGTRKDYRQFVTIARGSANELQTQIELAQRIGLLASKAGEELQMQTLEVSRMLHNLWAYLSPKKTEKPSA